MCKEKELIGKKVLVDTDAEYIIAGTLVEFGKMLILEDVDVHSTTESTTTRELYVIDVAKLGVRANRKRIHLMASRVVCISLLEDIIEY